MNRIVDVRTNPLGNPVFKKIVLLGVSVVIALVAFEVYLRVFPPRILTRVDNLHSLLRYDPLLGYVMSPHLRQLALSEDGVTEYMIETNEHGLRDAPFRGKDGRKVVLGLGDSFLFGDGVKVDDTIMSQLQEMFERSSPGKYRAVNAGMIGYSTNQEILYYLSRGRQLFGPEIVVLFYMNNDITVPLHSPPRLYEGIHIPDFGNLYRQNTSGQPRLSWRTHAFAKLCWNALRKGPRTPLAALHKTPLIDPEMALFNRETQLKYETGETYKPFFRSMWSVFKQKTEDAGAQLLVVYLPSSAEVVDGRARRDIIHRYSYPPSAWDFDMASKSFVAEMARQGIRCLNLQPAFRKQVMEKGDVLFIHNEGHFTPAGCRLTSEYVHDELMRMERGEASSSAVGAEPPLSVHWRRVESEIPGEWLDANGIIRRVVPDVGNKRLDMDLTGRVDERSKGIRLYIHPRSSPLVLSLLSGTQVIDRALAVPDPQGLRWGEMNIDLTPFHFSSGTSLVASVQSRDPRRRIVFTLPHVVHRPSDSRPPVVLVCIDSLRGDHLPFHGYTRNTAPNLSALAADAAVYEDVTASSAWCLPSLVSLMTGVDPFTHKVVRPENALMPQIPTLAEFLSDAGYVTLAVSGHSYAGHQYLRGFHTYTEYAAADPHGDLAFNRPTVLNWLQNRGDESFFLFAHTAALSGPYVGDEFRSPSMTPGSPEEISARYDAGILRADAFIGEIMGVLKQIGVYDRSLIVVTADHGEELNDRSRTPAYYGHGHSTRQEVIRVPLVIKYPAGRPSSTVRRVRAPVGLVDVVPTVIAELGMPLPIVLDGEPLQNVSDAPMESAHPDRLYLFGNLDRRMESEAPWGMRLGRYKLAVMDNTIRAEEPMPGMLRIYDLLKDPTERDDLAPGLLSKGRSEPKDLWRTFRGTVSYRAMRFTDPTDVP